MKLIQLNCFNIINALREDLKYDEVSNMSAMNVRYRHTLF